MPGQRWNCAALYLRAAHGDTLLHS
jgi:hypothetical protein